MDIQILEPFHKITEDQEVIFNRELTREIGLGHILFGKEFRCIAKRLDCDDCLFYLPQSEEYALVHLTWTKGESPEFPNTEIFTSYKDLLDHWDDF